MPKESVPPDLLPPEADAVIGGSLGRHASARERSVGRLLPFVVAMTVVPMGIAVLRQGHCIAQGWNGDEQFWRMCFSDLPAQYQLAGLTGGLSGWLDGSALTDQMPLLSGLMALLGGLVPDGGWLAQTRVYFLLWAIVLAACAAVIVWCVGLLRPRRLDLATQLALSPVHVVATLLSPDLLVVTLVFAAMLARGRHRSTAAGGLLGLALLGHAWVLIAGLALLVSARRGGDLGGAIRTAVVAAATAAVLLLLVAVMQPHAISGPLMTWWDSKPGYGSLLFIPELIGHPLPDRIAPVFSLIGWSWAIWAVIVMAARAWRPATWAQVAAFAVPVVALTSPSVPVQAALWVLPLAILAGVSWRTHLGFVLIEAGHAAALWLYIGYDSDPDKGLPPSWYAVAIIGRTIAWGLLMWSIWYTPVDNPPPSRPQPPRPVQERPQTVATS